MSSLVSISDLFAFFKDEHVAKCSYSEWILTGLVRANMKVKVYPVLVSVSIKLSLSILAIQCVLYSCQHSTRKETLNQ
jgi:hypothetical protein